tara:strand:+ start:99 stop:485 length:387 start_codon:yes stop_codon:yes gene_type:complete
MTEKEKLYDAFGELIYAVAKADGEIQKEEIEALKSVLENNHGAKEINWSFNYEISKDHSIYEAYSKAINICKEYGPSKEYLELINILEKVAQSSNGIDNNEQNIIDNLRKDLTDRFKKDLEDLNLLKK